MRFVTAGLMLAVATLGLSVSPAVARGYVYDTQYCARAYDGVMECAYFTLQQCLAAVSATGGDCALNPRYAGERVRPRRWRR